MSANPFDNDKLLLKTKPIPGGSFPPSLKLDVYKHNPSIWVSTGMRKNEGVTFVRAGIEPKTAGLLCRLIETVAKAPTPQDKAVTATIECKQGKEKELVAKIVVGKEKNGRVFISVLNVKDSSAPVIQFFFGSDIYHPVTLSWANDNYAEVSVLAALEFADRARTFWQLDSYHNPPVKEERNGGGNRGGYNNNNNNSGSNNGGWSGGGNNSAPTDEDLPWG